MNRHKIKIYGTFCGSILSLYIEMSKNGGNYVFKGSGKL